MQFHKVRSFSLELEGCANGLYRSGEALSGHVVVELGREMKVKALEVCARGVATVHWLESRSVGMNTVYSDYTSFESYLRRRLHLIRGLEEICPNHETHVLLHWRAFCDRSD